MEASSRGRSFHGPQKGVVHDGEPQGGDRSVAMSAESDARADAVLAVLAASATSDYIGEEVNQLEHALQAAHFARQAGASDAQVLAALMHDIGHLLDPEAPNMAGLGVIEHERVGADYLRAQGFSESVARLVEGHVQAKRYLTFAKPAYAARLSEASRGTLAWQGGPMDAKEAAAFEADPLFRPTLAMRTWDERAKVVGLEVMELEGYRAGLVAHLQGAARGDEASA
jgi:putative nucleotidyltransferase with HDIG domain